LSRLGQLRRALAMYIPANNEASSRIILKRKDASSVESWDECGIYDKVNIYRRQIWNFGKFESAGRFQICRRHIFFNFKRDFLIKII
jgi:hypothetical protein